MQLLVAGGGLVLVFAGQRRVGAALQDVGAAVQVALGLAFTAEGAQAGFAGFLQQQLGGGHAGALGVGLAFVQDQDPVHEALAGLHALGGGVPDEDGFFFDAVGHRF